jgi:hypothetical protein
VSTDQATPARVTSRRQSRLSYEPSLGRYIALFGVLGVMVVAIIELHNAMALWPLMIVAIGVFCADPAVITELVKLVRRSS